MYWSSSEPLQRLNIGIGDEAFMIGHFPPTKRVGVDTPVARFGNVSLWPAKPIRATPDDGEDFSQDNSLVEMRSQGGSSGSPVFVIVEPGSMRAIDNPPAGLYPYFTPLGKNIAFIGVDRGHLGYSTTAMALVVPDSQLIEVLDRPELRAERARFRREKVGSAAGGHSGGGMS